MAVKCYKTETKLFTMISEALIKAGQEIRATTYLKKALELEPSSEKVQTLIAKVKSKSAT